MRGVDLVIVGGGAAGLMAATWAGRMRPGRRIVVLDGAGTLGAKIVVSGGGRCNVTHDEVDERQYCGSSAKAIRKVLRRFDVPETVQFFRERGVHLKREETGKLFPTDDSARSVLRALLEAARLAGVELAHPRRVTSLRRDEAGGFVVAGEWGEIVTPRVVLATGGKSLPKSGSDGFGLELARRLGHSIVALAPALVPLELARGSFVRELSGLTLPAELVVRTSTGRRLSAITGSLLCTHFGISGPAAMDVSRHWMRATADDPGATVAVNWLPGETFESVDAALLDGGRASAGRFLATRLPERLAHALCVSAGFDASVSVATLSREARHALAHAVVETILPVTGDRGWSFAETTAGGVPLSEVRLETMESRSAPGLHLAGEMLDVDGRIGGYSFQWAWASGYVAGVSA